MIRQTLAFKFRLFVLRWALRRFVICGELPLRRILFDQIVATYEREFIEDNYPTIHAALVEDVNEAINKIS